MARTHLDASVDDLIPSGERFLFALSGLDPYEDNLVRSRLNHDGEGHATREVALTHLASVHEFETNLRRHLKP